MKETLVKYLAGLMDADGSLSFTFKNYEKSSEDVFFLGLNMSLASSDAVDRAGFIERLSEETEKYCKRFANIPSNQLALNKMLINQAFENMGLRTTQMLGTFFDGVTRHTEEALRWREDFGEVGFRETIRRRDGPFGDYGERPR